MDVSSLFEVMPFARFFGIEITAAIDGHAEGRLPFREEFRSSPTGDVAHGAVAYALCDTIAGAAVISLAESVTPTIDMRIDYLRPITDDLEATADVRRLGDSVAVADVSVVDSGGTVATARGAYKTGGYVEDTAWTGGGVPVGPPGRSDDSIGESPTDERG